MLRKTKNIAIYKGGGQAGKAGALPFAQETTTRLLPGAIARVETEADSSEAKVIRERAISSTHFNASKLKGGQWRHTW